MEISITLDAEIPDAVAITQLNTIWEVLDANETDGAVLTDFADGLSYILGLIVFRESPHKISLMEQCAAEMGDKKALELKRNLQMMIDQIDAGLKEEPTNA